jgi:hypothetical protein
MKILKFILILCCCQLTVILNASQQFVTFPSRDVLQKSLQDAGFGYFAELSNIAKIADEKLVSYKVIIELNKALYDVVYNANCYINNEKNRRKKTKDVLSVFDRDRGTLLTILLQNDPGALAQLKKDFKF